MNKISSILHAIVIVLMNVISKPILMVLMFLRLNVRYKNLREIYTTRGPFLLLPNHTNAWDPFILSFIIPRPIHWVASDGAFRDSLLKVLMLMGGAIPKIKEQSDLLTLQAVKQAITMGHAVGIFPEGGQTWDGCSLDLIPATAKLIRYLKVPVLVPIIQGGYLTKPRWAWGIRRCRIEVHFKRIINFEEIATLKLAEIEQRLKGAIVQDDYKWQKKAMVPIVGERRAEKLELAFYACPSCEEIGTMTSLGNTLTCQCGYLVSIDRYGFFNYLKDGPSFDSPRDWIEWQNFLLIEKFRDAINGMGEDLNGGPVLLQDSAIRLMMAKRAMPMRPIHQGDARLYPSRIEVGNIGGEIITFPLREISAVTTFKQQKFEFRYDKNQYRFAMPNRSISGYKWEIAYKGLRQILVERGAW